MKKMEINDRLYNVLDKNTYNRNPSLYNPKFTAIECNDGETILPVSTNKTDEDPGVYYVDNGMVGIVNKPSEEDADKYSSEHVIDFNKSKDVGDIIKKTKLVRDIQSDIMATSDNILQLNIADRDSQPMVALKRAINAKHVDKKFYEDRFDQFQNDMRLLRGNSITLGKLISICKAFDIDAELTLKDAEDAPNPMNNEISISLTQERSE